MSKRIENRPGGAAASVERFMGPYRKIGLVVEGDFADATEVIMMNGETSPSKRAKVNPVLIFDNGSVTTVLRPPRKVFNEIVQSM